MLKYHINAFMNSVCFLLLQIFDTAGIPFLVAIWQASMEDSAGSKD